MITDALGYYVLGSLLALASASAEEITIVFAGAAETPAHRGALQGLAEANVQGEFLGIRYRLVADEIDTVTDPVAIIAAVDPTRLVQIVERHTTLPVLNVTARETSLREDCRNNLFHIAPSTAMIEDAQYQWQQRSPGSPATARAWHQTFRKYAAAQLNLRFRDRFASAMDDDAWAGWAAMKLLAALV